MDHEPNFQSCPLCQKRFDTVARNAACPHEYLPGMEPSTDKVDPLAPKVPEGHGANDGRAVPGQTPQPHRRVTNGSGAAVTNNIMRHNYKPLSAEEKADMKAVKDIGLEFYQLLQKISTEDKAKQASMGKQIFAEFSSRELSLAATKIEESVMWAVKHLTK